ncbi:MAG: hypothetical protein D3924_02975, partial [Candidatus Electrothrix sp. AR4]|nr:hypothetical protein [Candidatus Electrothrix sp. AR4]
MNSARTRIYKFLSLLYQDEIPLSFIERMVESSFLEQLSKTEKSFAINGFERISSGLTKMIAGLRSGSTTAVYKELCYEYAALFLNAGK